MITIINNSNSVIGGFYKDNFIKIKYGITEFDDNEKEDIEKFINEGYIKACIDAKQVTVDFGKPDFEKMTYPDFKLVVETIFDVNKLNEIKKEITGKPKIKLIEEQIKYLGKEENKILK